MPSPLVSNLELAEVKLQWQWRVLLGLTFIYLYMFTQVSLEPRLASLEAEIATLTKKQIAARRLDLYREAYLTAGAVAIELKLREGKALPSVMDSNCQGMIRANEPGRQAVIQALHQCATWALFQALVLDPASQVPVQNFGGTRYFRPNVRQDFPSLSESEMTGLPATTGLDAVPNWDLNVLGAQSVCPEVRPLRWRSWKTICQNSAEGVSRFRSGSRSLIRCSCFELAQRLLVPLSTLL
jgi:hypothetical protein